jgi:hypothetical protein
LRKENISEEESEKMKFFRHQTNDASDSSKTMGAGSSSSSYRDEDAAGAAGAAGCGVNDGHESRHENR